MGQIQKILEFHLYFLLILARIFKKGKIQKRQLYLVIFFDFSQNVQK